MTAHLSRTRRAGLIVLAVVAMAAGLWWPQTRPAVLAETFDVSLSPVDPPTGAVEIVGVDAGVVWADNEPAKVIMSVRNRSDRPVTAEVWWLLAPVGVTQPWADPTGQGQPQRVRLAAEETLEVTVEAEKLPPAGNWNLSLWAHAIQGEERTPSHGVNAAPLVRVLSAYPDIARFGQPGGRAIISMVQPNGRLLGLPATGQPDAHVSVEAATQQPTEVEVRCYLTPRPNGQPWLNGPVIASDPAPLTLDGTSIQVAPCTFPALPTSGRWSLSAFVWRQAGFLPEPPEDAVHLQQQVSLDPVTAPDSSMAGQIPAPPLPANLIPPPPTPATP